MATDYVPGLIGPDPSNMGTGSILQGSDVPSNSIGSNGNIYVNISNGDIYTKSGDVWTLHSAGAGATEIIAGAVDDPNGVHTPADTTKSALYYRDSAGNDNVQFWRWSIADQEWKGISTT